MRRSVARVVAQSPLAVAAASAAEFCDLRDPASLYPLARRLGPRRITLHLGPTNSGKTFAALEALKHAPRGLYCSPLRLLAWEVYEKMISSGKPCELVTGQEREAWAPPRDASPVAGEYRRGGVVVSSTVECASLEAVVDVCVLDEIQMLACPSRGWAWTRVLLGVPATDIHLCGDAAAEPLVRRIADMAGDEITTIRYSRLSPLIVGSSAVRSWADLQPGDAVVAFSRKSLFEMTKSIEQTTGLRTAIIYGSLPPLVRRDQAKRFNGEASSAPLANVLVASDAIGMGLNLAVRRVVFSTLVKFDGISRRALNVSEIKQIGGRAGRFGGTFTQGGEVTAVETRHLGAIKKALDAPTPELSTAGLAPTYEQLEAFAVALASRLGLLDEAASRAQTTGVLAIATRLAAILPFSSIIRLFAEKAKIDRNMFFLSESVFEMARVAALVDDIDGLDFRARYNFALAPLHLDDGLHVAALKRYAKHFVGGRVSVGLRVPESPPRSPDQVATLESVHRVFDLYVWLARVYSVEFCFLRDAMKRADHSASLITQGLEILGSKNVSSFMPRKGGTMNQRRGDKDFLLSLIDDENDGGWLAEPEAVRPRRFKGRRKR